MFGFKAHYIDEHVYIGGQSYLNNEILNAILCLSTRKLTERLAELRSLRNKVLLIEGASSEYCDQYDDNVQRAQNLFYYVGNIAKDIPVYKKTELANKLDTPLLFDCLNEHFIYWEHGNGFDDDDPRYKDEDYANELGFVSRDAGGNYGFYVQHFYLVWSMLSRADTDYVLAMQETNDAVCKLFDEFIVFVEDVLRVQTAYAELLDNYIHADRHYLTDSETAECFTRYLKQTEKRGSTERLGISGSMQMSYEVLTLPDGESRLCETYTFDSLGAFLYVDFFRGLSRCHIPKRCDNCGRYFLIPAGKYTSYCERKLKDDPGKTCRDIGARKRYDDKCKTDPVWLAYNRAYKAHYARYMKKKMTTAQFEQWSRYAVEIRDKAESGELELVEYQRLLKI